MAKIIKKTLSVFFMSIFLIISTANAESKGKITSIDSTGYVYIDLGSKDGIKEGDVIEIYDGGTKILTLPVKIVYNDQSQLEAPDRRDLSKLREGQVVITKSKEEQQGFEGKVITFDLTEGSGFINLGALSGIEEGMTFEVIKENEIVANVKVAIVFDKTSKVLLIDKTPAQEPLEGLYIRLKEERKAAKGKFQEFWKDIKSKFSGEVRSIYSQYDISGAVSQSFYERSRNYREELDLRYVSQLANKNIEGFISGRWTDDKYVDPVKFSIEDFYVEAKDKWITLRAGDISGNFSGYSLLTSLKGIRPEFRSSNNFGDWACQSIFGVNKSRWEDLYDEIKNETYTRYVGGLRLSQDIGKDLKLGLNFVSSDDDKDGSAPAGTVPVDNKVTSLDLETKVFQNLGIKAELASSFTKLNESRADEHFKNDFAYDLNTDYDLNHWHFDNDYERVGANFRSLSGVALSDREEHYHRIEYKPLRAFSSAVGYRYYRDNLKDLSTRTTFTDVYEANISMYPLSKLPDLLADLGFELRKRTSSDTSIDESNATYSIDLSNTTGFYTHGFGYTFIRKWDDVTLSNIRRKQIWDTFVRSSYKLSQDIQLIPNISYSIETDRQRSTENTDAFQNLRGGFVLYLGRLTSVNLNYSFSDTDYKVTSRDQIRYTVDFNLRHIFFNHPDRIIELTLKQNDYMREEGPTSFTEKIYNISYTQRF